jgi:hypothetical protein
MVVMRAVLALAMAVLTCLAGCATAREHGDAAPADAGGADAAPADGGIEPTGHSVHGTVSGGVKASSPNYQLLGTVGRGQPTASSPRFRLQGGVVGAAED